MVGETRQDKDGDRRLAGKLSLTRRHPHRRARPRVLAPRHAIRAPLCSDGAVPPRGHTQSDAPWGTQLIFTTALGEDKPVLYTPWGEERYVCPCACSCTLDSQRPMPEGCDSGTTSGHRPTSGTGTPRLLRHLSSQKCSRLPTPNPRRVSVRPLTQPRGQARCPETARTLGDLSCLPVSRGGGLTRPARHWAHCWRPPYPHPDAGWLPSPGPARTNEGLWPDSLCVDPPWGPGVLAGLGSIWKLTPTPRPPSLSLPKQDPAS